MRAEIQFEIAVAGGGMIGAAIARALAADLRGGRIALISREPRPQLPGADFDANFDARVYAISPGNAAFLAQLGVWDAIPAAHRTPVHAMRVFGDDGAARIEFDAYRSGVGELAWIVEERRVQEALWRGLEAQAGVAIFAGAPIRRLDIGEKQADILLDDGRALAARLLVGADGANSMVRTCAGIAHDARDYSHAALVANFACGRPHRNVAWQWFQGSGDAGRRGAVLALLPLPGDHVSMVWSLPAPEAARLAALEATALAREVAEATGHALGELSPVTPPRSFLLRRLSAARLAAPRVALAGDAAHVIHPLAGQGANLGLQDAQALAAVMRAREPGRDPGGLRLLRRYERSRAEAILAMRATVHGLFRLFEAPGAARLRNAGLNLADRMPVLKNLLMRHAMG